MESLESSACLTWQPGALMGYPSGLQAAALRKVQLLGNKESKTIRLQPHGARSPVMPPASSSHSLTPD